MRIFSSSHLFQGGVAGEGRGQALNGVVAPPVVGHDQGPPPVLAVIGIAGVQHVAVEKQRIP